MTSCASLNLLAVCLSVLAGNTSQLNMPEDPCCVSGEVKENAKKHPSL